MSNYGPNVTNGLIGWKMERKLTRKEKLVINKLNALAKIWPDTLALFADSGSLLVIDANTFQVLDEITEIDCDGGDPDRYYDDDDIEFINKPPI
jgi:hypothetical protein